MLGEAASLGAAMIWSCSMTLFSVQGNKLPPAALNLFKNVVAMACFVVAWLVMRPPLPDASNSLGLLALSGIVGLAVGDTALFAALTRLGAQVTSASQCLAPPIAALIATWTLGETLSLQEGIGLMVTVSAVAGVVHFGRRHGSALADLPGRTIAIGILFALLAALCQAVGLVLSRYAFQGVDTLSGTIARVGPAMVLLLMMTSNARTYALLRTVSPTRKQLGWLTLAAFLGTFLGLLLMSIGVKHTKTGVAAALTSTYPIWIIPIAHFILKKRVNWQTVACTVLAVGGIVLLLGG